MTIQTAGFTRIEDSTAEDWAILMPGEIDMARGLPQRVLAHLQLLDDEARGYPVNRLSHSLQTATRAERDGRDAEYVVCALLHDIGDTLGAYNHAAIAAAILKPFVSEANLWMVEHHGLFQGYHFFHHIGLDRHARDALRGQPHFAHTEDFVTRYDNCAFDPAYDTRPLAHFAPLVQQVMAMPRQSIYRDAIPTP